ncbi:MAG: DUF4363 family protein [Clostridia bacterium]|nr:DUF4363 family protein [Clostridia bacterium]
MGFTVFRSCMTVLICLFLLMLFLVPSAYLDRFCSEADARIEAAESALLSGDLPAAAPHCAALFSLVRERMPVLERFLNHASIDALDAAVAVADCAVQANDAGAAAEALREAQSILVRIRGIELFSWNSLL